MPQDGISSVLGKTGAVIDRSRLSLLHKAFNSIAPQTRKQILDALGDLSLNAGYHASGQMPQTERQDWNISAHRISDLMIDPTAVLGFTSEKRNEKVHMINLFSYHVQERPA